MSSEKPEALELADLFDNWAATFGEHPSGSRSRGATELRRLHGKVQELEGLLASVGVSAQRVTQSQTLKASSGWLIDGGLLYRLNDEGANCDEINVTMACGLRTEAARVELAEAILNMLTIQKAADHIEQDLKMVAVQEPFGYFKAEPFGWRDCAETDEGAIALYDAPQQQKESIK